MAQQAGRRLQCARDSQLQLLAAADRRVIYLGSILRDEPKNHSLCIRFRAGGYRPRGVALPSAAMVEETMRALFASFHFGVAIVSIAVALAVPWTLEGYTIALIAGVNLYVACRLLKPTNQKHE